MNITDTYKVKSDDIYFSVPVETIKKMRGQTPENGIFGQPRAMAALKTGLGITAKGFNIFVMGEPGTGRRTALMSLLDACKKDGLPPDDILYVFNFERPAAPRALLLPAGKGKKLQSLLDETIRAIRKQLHAMETGDSFSAARKNINRVFEEQQQTILSHFEKEMQDAGFKPVQTPENGMDLVPVINGEAVSFNELQTQVNDGTMSSDAWNKLRGEYYQCVDRIAEISAEMAALGKKSEKDILELRRNFSEPIIRREMESVKAEAGTVADWLDEIAKDIIKHLDIFTETKRTKRQAQLLHRYEINLLCDRGGSSEVPVIQEELPTFSNLFGSIELPQNAPDTVDTGHLRLRPGAVHRACGGYLVLRFQDLIQEEGAWSYLKKVLQSGLIEFQQLPGSMQSLSQIKPCPLPATLKVIILGGSQSYDLMFHEDPDFYKLFKICAEFDSSMPWTDETVGQYISFCDSYVEKRRLRPLDETALAEIIVYGARLAGYRTRLSTRFTLIADLLTEADYAAKQAGRSVITGSDVTGARAVHQYFVQLPEEKVLTAIHDDEIILNVTGTAVGCVNGLAVLDRGFYSFGIPVSVTACTAPGEKGIINVEGEAGLSGEIYDKALFIIQGLIRRRYARETPLAMTASICFEQSYTGVDGDSASCAELFALLSALTGIPLRQDIAVTGSINQMGEVQPVGGITEKVEGFFKVCKMKGLTGTQGCVIPRRNIPNLVLSAEMQRYIQDGKFHIWAINTVDEGMELLSGMIAGEQHEDGSFPPDTFNDAIRKTLVAYADQVHRFTT